MGAHVADGDVVDAFDGVQAVERAGFFDYGEQVREVAWGEGVVVDEAAGAAVLGAVGEGGGAGGPLGGG